MLGAHASRNFTKKLLKENRLESNALVASFLALLNFSAGHASMTMPRARGTLSTNAFNLPGLGITGVPMNGCPFCQNAGGVVAVQKSGSGVYSPYETTTKSMLFRIGFGLCGDKKSQKAPRDHEKGGKYGSPSAFPVSATYKTGPTVTLQIDLNANHNGFFKYYICDVSKCGGDISQKCFQGGHCKKLMGAPVAACDMQQSKDCGPIDPNYPGQFYVPCKKAGNHRLQMKYNFQPGFPAPAVCCSGAGCQRTLATRAASRSTSRNCR